MHRRTEGHTTARRMRTMGPPSEPEGWGLGWEAEAVTSLDRNKLTCDLSALERAVVIRPPRTGGRRYRPTCWHRVGALRARNFPR